MKKCSRFYDCIVIGGGPAGITSAIYLARRNLCVLILYENLGGQASLTADIENYSGFRSISGAEFTQKLDEHLKKYDITSMQEKVMEVKKSEDMFDVKTESGEYKGKTLIIASGARQKKLGIPGEDKYLNKGVAYCATCDAPLYKDREIAIIGGGNSALEGAIQLESYAKKIYIVTIDKKLEGEDILVDKIKSFENLEIICCSSIGEIKGDKFVESIVIETDGKTREIKVQGVFVEIGYQPNSEFVDAEKNEHGEIILKNNNQTSISGMFAAGDVTNVKGKQIIIAAGEGAKAALCAAEYLSRMD